VTRFLNEQSAELFGASFHVCDDASVALETIMRILDGRREKLGINRAAERKLYDMKDRRELKV
jgi:hypothetical protein